MSEEKYPEHDKLRPIQEQSQAICDFLEWLSYEKDMTVCKPHDETNEYFPVFVRKEELTAEFFGIDLKKLDAEKRAMLEEMRKVNEQ